MKNNKISNYIELLKNPQYGVLSVDIGSLVNENEEWSQDVGFCIQEAKGIHEEVSNLYKSVVGTEPVNFLFEYFKCHPGSINRDYYVYSFNVDLNLFHTEDVSDSIVTCNVKDDFKIIEDNRGNADNNDDPLGGEEVREFIKKKFFNELTKENFVNKDPYEKFDISQQAFTNAVGYVYYKKGLPLKYATIILLTYKRDGCSFFSHSIVLFSSQSLSDTVSLTNEDAISDPTLQLIFENIRGDKYLDRIEELSKKLQKESEKSAKAAIMSRNMSHNLGSHVMAYLKQQLGSVTSIMKEENKVLDNLIPESIKTDLKNYLECTINKSNPLEGKNGTHGFINKLKILFKLENNKNESANNTNLETVTSILECIDKWEPTKIENVEMPFLVGLGRFINYLQERQDYIATISTDYIPYGAPVNLKDAIYDELNPDLRYLRHKNESNNDAKNKPANILLNYIAKSEGISRENMKGDFVSEKDIRLGFVYYSSEGLKLFGLDTPNDNTQAAFESKNAALTQMRKINFSLPGGLVGRQAIFSIFENLIRNAAKHGDTTGVTNLDFTLDVIDGSDISWDVNHRELNGMVNNPKVIQWESRVCDKIWRNLYEKAYDLDDIYLLTITDNLPCSEPVINKLKMGLYEDFVDFNTSQMTTANKGIKEVRISAAWIRGVTDEKCYLEYPKNRNSDMLLSIDSEYVDKDPNNKSKKLAPLVAVEMSDDGHLRYIVCVRKNKTVAIVSKVKTEIEGKEISIDFDADALEMFMKLREEDKDRWTILSDDELINSKTSYSFILCPDDEIAFNAIRPYTSNRLCRWIVNEESKNALAGMDKEDKTLMYIYQLFTGLNEKNEDIFIEDERARTANNERERLEGKQHFYKIRFETDDNTSNKYLYRTHHATEKEYKGFYSQHINMGESYACVEGITGDNSSDRLVRREWLDERWYYTHLYALRKKVAIIDERLFKMVHNIDEKLFVSNSNEMIQTKELKNVHLEIDFENLKEQISQTIDNDELVESILSTKTIDELSEYVSEVPRNIFDNSQVDNSVMGECHLTPYYHGKAIDIYTVVKDAEGKMILVGCVKTEFNVKTNTFCNTFAKLATFMPDQDTGFALKPVSNEYKNLFANCYDYISIHQGILDKIYDNLGIKNSDSNKCRLTRCIHQSLMDDKKTIGDYLPRFIIHSGRAKPSREDMPQLQPFVQYAAIENAVKDCKSMLVELLDFAKYEPANN